MPTHVTYPLLNDNIHIPVVRERHRELHEVPGDQRPLAAKQIQDLLVELEPALAVVLKLVLERRQRVAHGRILRGLAILRARSLHALLSGRFARAQVLDHLSLVRLRDLDADLDGTRLMADESPQEAVDKPTGTCKQAG